MLLIKYITNVFSKKLSKKFSMIILLFLLTSLYSTYLGLFNNEFSFIMIKYIQYKYAVNSFLDFYLPTLNEESFITVDVLKYSNDYESLYNQNYFDTSNSICKMPQIKFDNNVSIHYLNEDYKILKLIFESCNKNQSIKSLIVSNNELNRLYLRIDIVWKRFSIDNHTSFIECHVQKFDKIIEESEEKENLRYSEDVFFLNHSNNYSTTLSDFGYFYVSCYDKMYKNKLLFDQVLNIYPKDMSLLKSNRENYNSHQKEFKSKLDKKTRQQKFENNIFSGDEKITNNTNENKLNILLIGIDSVSANHFRRIFPLTHDFLSHHLDSNVIFDNFHSAGSNTYPNLIAMLTGIVEEDLHYSDFNISGEIDFYRNLNSTFHDNLPFLWYEFENQGYLTHFQEDMPSIAIFNYLKKGFKYWPTNIYGRPYWSKYYKIRNGPDKCHNNEPTYITWLNQIQNFVENTYKFNRNESNKQKMPFFSLNFLSEYTHNYLAVPKNFDLELKEMLQNFNSKGYLDDSVLIFFTDHGNRLKYYSYSTEIGKLEKNMPFLSIKLPKKIENSKFYRNIFNNKHKLVSFFDLYQTLRHFCYMNYKQFDLKHLLQGKNRQQFRNNSKFVRHLRGVSLFETVSLNRTCSDALIPEKLCSCFKQELLNIEQKFSQETGGETFLSASSLVLDHINNLTNKIRLQCKLFKLKRVVSFKKIYINDLVKFYTNVAVLEPGDAWFETKFKLINGNLKIENDPVRISAYGDQSKCIKDTKLVNYCYCNNS
jgi:hypothetical protein